MTALVGRHRVGEAQAGTGHGAAPVAFAGGEVGLSQNQARRLAVGHRSLEFQHPIVARIRDPYVAQGVSPNPGRGAHRGAAQTAICRGEIVLPQHEIGVGVGDEGFDEDQHSRIPAIGYQQVARAVHRQPTRRAQAINGRTAIDRS